MNTVCIEHDRAGLEEAQRDRDRHAAKLAAALNVDPKAVMEAIECPQEWPTR